MINSISNRAFIGLTLVATSMLYGCAATMSKEEINNTQIADVPDNYKQQIKDYLETRLIDPKSAEIFYDSSPKGKVVKFVDRKQTVIWEVICQVNAKNAQGGLTGRKTVSFYFHDGKVVGFNPISENGEAASASISHGKASSSPNAQRYDMEMTRIRSNSQFTSLSHLD